MNNSLLSTRLFEYFPLCKEQWQEHKPSNETLTKENVKSKILTESTNQ